MGVGFLGFKCCMACAIVVGTLSLLFLAASSAVGGPQGVVTSSGGVSGKAGGVADGDRVSAVGGYDTSFQIPVPPAPGAPHLALSYDSGAGGSLAGVGWDLSVGWPTSIVRDVRFGTPRWLRASPWVWGTAPLVSTNAATCVQTGVCEYRTGPDTRTTVRIDVRAGLESATVRLSTGTTLAYEPIIYDGVSYPPPPAGAQTPVLAFRLVSVTDRNGYLTCFRYEPANDPTRGRVAMLSEIAYGLSPLASTCSAVLASSRRHRIDLKYDTLSLAGGDGFFSTWTVRFGAPVSFTQLLKSIEVRPLGAQPAQDVFTLNYAGATTETHRPLLARIDQTVVNTSGGTVTRAVRAFRYGNRSPQYGPATVLDLGALGSFPDSLAGTISRPIKRLNPNQNPGGPVTNPLGLFQAGQDVGTDVAPPSHATTEQWSFSDVNGDGLPDLQWGKEAGFGPTAPWPTCLVPSLGCQVGFEGLLPVNRASRPPQQEVLINDGIAGSSLGSSQAILDGSATSLSSSYSQEVPPAPSGTYSSWFWGEGRGETRTGMPVSISAPEIVDPASSCAPAPGQDTRLWPVLPDGTTNQTPGSVAQALTNFGTPHLMNNTYFGNPILSIVEGIYAGYHPTYGVSSTVSGWADLNGDGVQEFVGTPAWIERFHIRDDCRDQKDPAGINTQQVGAREDCPATTGSLTAFPCPAPDTDWRVAPFGPIGAPGTTSSLSATPVSGPAGPVGLPLAYSTSTSDAESFGVTLPIGGLTSAVVAAAAGGGWIALASAAPGLTVDTFTPRSQFGGTLAVQGPSLTAIMQGVASLAKSGSAGEAGSASLGGTSVAGLISSLIGLKFDLTIATAAHRMRSETQAQLLDVNADGLPDYVLYDSGSNIPGVPAGSLIAFLRTPAGGFGSPMVLNAGPSLAYPPLQPIGNTTMLDSIDADVRTAKDAANLSTATSAGSQDTACSVGPLACVAFAAELGVVVAKADAITGLLTPFMTATTDTIPREQTLTELKVMRDTLHGFIDAVVGLSAAGGLPPPLWPAAVDAAAADAKALTDTLGHLARTVRHLAYPSRVNTPGQSFSGLEGGFLTDPATGFAAQTRGFVDLNADGLPDYVITNDRQSSCSAGQWEVFWGAGTSSISAGRAFLPTPSCLSVPAPPADALPSGLTTLPLSVERIFRKPTNNPYSVDTLVHSYVSLTDFNRDGLPDILIAGSNTDPWSGPGETTGNGVGPRTWHVFLNNGNGFETTSSVDVTSPTAARSDVEPASPLAAGLDVFYPTMQATHTVGTVVGSQSRDVTETNAGMVDIDGDGVPEVVRRVHILPSSPGDPKREGLLVWKRASTGPQDLMIEDRYPLTGGRYLIDYRPASAFQWKDGEPTGQAPQAGHHSLAGAGAFLVRSVTTEKLLGRTEQRTASGYDYKSPFYDQATRTATGFALRSRVALDPNTGEPIGSSVADAQRSAQRPNGVGGITDDRQFIAGTGAPVRETLTSYAESPPTASGGAGGLQAIFTAPARTFVTEYPTGLTKGPVFDVGFDGREPLRERVSGNTPVTTGSEQIDPTAPTGGAGTFAATPPDVLTYSSAPLPSATIETWLRPDAIGVVANQVGAYQLRIANVAGASRWQLDVGGSPRVVSSEPVALGRWQYVVATFGPGGARIFVNGRTVGSGTAGTAPTPNGALLVGCSAVGPPAGCFAGQIGELRIYPEEWTTAPRVTDSQVELQLANPAGSDFGQALRVLDRNDMARDDDDVATEYQYASPASAAQPAVLGLVANKAQRVLLPNGTSGNYLSYTQHTYDNLAAGLAANGNETAIAQFDGPAETTSAPTAQQLRVVTRTSYDPNCPGDIAKVTDPAGFSTTTTWDRTCAFPLEVQNALGETSSTHYYGVNTAPAAHISGPYGSYILDGRYGQLAESVDANGAITRTAYDEWGRPVAVWAPLDRRDRPGKRFEYTDASCEAPDIFGPGNGTGTATVVEKACGDTDAPGLSLRSPARTTSLVWDDQLRRCETNTHRIIPCSSPAARTFADEQSTGAYTTTYSFGDGQTQTQSVTAHRPAWTLDGIADFDLLGRTVRTYRVQNLPPKCAPAGTWCTGPRPRTVAASQTSYDAQSRPVRLYGPTTPTCPNDPVGQPACTAALLASVPHPDVTQMSYPAPGMTETTNAKGIPTVVKLDSRGLATSDEEYVRPSPGSTPAHYSTLTTAYDRLGRAVATTDENGNTSHTEYDALSRVSATDDPDRGRTTNQYDTRSNLMEQLVASGEKTVHVYDALSRRTQTDYLRPKVVSNVPDRVPNSKPTDICVTKPDLGIPTPPEENTFRVGCSGLGAQLSIPLVARGKSGAQVVVQYRVFSQCQGGGRSRCQSGGLLIGYADKSAPDGLHILARPDYTPRSLDRLREPGEADSITARLPTDLLGKKYTLVIAYAAAQNLPEKRFVVDVVSIHSQQIVYLPEERVLRTYDSSEPPYYVAANVEQKPTFDFSFDVGGSVADRSSSATPLTCNGSRDETPGVEGRGLSLSPGSDCTTGTLAPALPRFTLEFWLRPHDYPVQPQAIWSATPFSIALLPSGKIACGPGPQVPSAVAVPTDAWTHVGLTYDGTRMRCSLNGVVQDDRALAGQEITTSTVAGGTAGIDIDELRVLPESRSVNEILRDALSPLMVGPPRGNLLELDFAHPHGGGTETDQSRAGNDAHMSGGAIVPGIEGMSFNTKKSGALVSVPDSQTLRLQTALTAELWIKRTSGPHKTARLIGKWSNGSPGWRLDFVPNSGRLKWEVATQLGAQLQHADFVTYEQLADNTWYHVAGTYDGRRLRVFINGLPAHRWCSDNAEAGTSATACPEPPRPTKCSTETLRPEGAGKAVLGDAVCVTGSVDNHVPLLIANDKAGDALRGLVDEVRLSNYAKKEFEVAASSKLASAYTQSIGEQTLLRNQLPVSNAVANQVAREHDAFDIQSRLVTSTSYVRHQRAAGDFVERAASDSLGRISLLEYPHGEVVVSGYDPDGTESSLIGYGPGIGQTAAQAQSYLSDATSTVTGRPATTTFGNGITTSTAYDDGPTSGGGFGRDTLKTSAVTSPTGALLGNRTYHWDVLGNLESVSDPPQSFSAGYGYDDLGRLNDSTLDVGGQTTASAYAYDPLGNLMAKDGAQQDYGRANLAPSCPPVSVPLPHALTRRTAAGQTARDPYCYDAAGKLLTSTDTPLNSVRNYSYFARGKVSRVSERHWNTDYAYEGDGNRVWTRESGPVSAEEEIPFPDFKEIAAGCEATYSAGATVIARRLLARSPGDPGCTPAAHVSWFTHDHLGSTNLLTDAAGTTIANTQAQYRPFGEFASAVPHLDESGSRQFTSRQLQTDGLYDLGARPYDPATGRFTQPDTIDQGGSPQSVNPYSYVLNNPLILVDPTGHQAADTQFVVDPVAGTNEVPLISSSPEEWLPYAPASANSPAPVSSQPSATPAAQPAVAEPPRGHATGFGIDVGGSLCVVFCAVLGDVQVGMYFTPPGPTDRLFNDAHFFVSAGGGFLGVTPAPENATDFAFGQKIPGDPCCQWSLGVSGGVGASFVVFESEANTTNAFSAYARNVGVGVGPFVEGVAENSSGQATTSFGVGFSHGWVAGANVYNSYTWLSRGLWSP